MMGVVVSGPVEVLGASVVSGSATGRNCYSTVSDFVTSIGRSDDGRFLDALETGSRIIDDYCRRYFYTTLEARVLPAGPDLTRIDVGDCLSVSEVLVDLDGDGVFETEWTIGTELYPDPINRYPRWTLRVLPEASVSAVASRRFAQVTGVFGFGDGRSADPWALVSGRTVAADALDSDTVLTVDGESGLSAGMTIRVGAEQMFVRAATSDGTNLITMDRGVNGTTAADVVAGSSIERALYPRQIALACHVLAKDYLRDMDNDPMMESEGIGDYRYKRAGAVECDLRMRRMLGAYALPVMVAGMGR